VAYRETVAKSGSGRQGRGRHPARRRTALTREDDAQRWLVNYGMPKGRLFDIWDRIVRKATTKIRKKMTPPTTWS